MTPLIRRLLETAVAGWGLWILHRYYERHGYIDLFRDWFSG